MDSNSKVKILFDGNCIVCDTEISYYARIAPKEFELVDIASPEFNASAFNLTTEAVNKHMHVQTPDGHIAKGVDAFAVIWSKVPKYHWASKIIKWPIIYQIAKVFYEIFARNRHRLPKRK